MKLTKTIVDKIQPPTDKPQAFYRDDALKGFALRVTANGAKSFVAEKLIDGKVKRITIGRYGELTVEQARKEAQKLFYKIAQGINPILEKKVQQLQKITLIQVFEDYLNARKNLREKTLYDYKRIVDNVFNDWKDKPFLSISKDNIAKRHASIGENHGHAYANLCMRVLRALFNFAAGQYEDEKGHTLITENPIKRLTQTRAWYRVERRKTAIKSHELSAWFHSVNGLLNATLRDYLLFILFTGLRRQEAAKLKWEQVDLKAKVITIANTKNYEEHTLPLSDYLYSLLTARKENAISEYVFPGSGESGYIVEPRKQMAKVINETGIKFSVHDLRRTFITTAESLDIAAYAVKRLVNHKMNNDVTAGYIVTDIERLRRPMQDITNYLLKCVGIKDSQPVLLKKASNVF